MPGTAAPRLGNVVAGTPSITLLLLVPSTPARFHDILCRCPVRLEDDAVGDQCLTQRADQVVHVDKPSQPVGVEIHFLAR